MSILPRESLLEYPDLYVVDSKPGSFTSGLKSLVAFEPGQVMSPITGLTPTPDKASTWSSVRVGLSEEAHEELNSVLAFTNHSCDPSSIMDMGSPDRSDWHVRALKKISPGDEITWFYPSTEWVSPTPFDCRCKAQNCIGRMRGSKYLSRQEVEGKGYISPWVSQLMRERDASTMQKDSRVAA